MSYKQRLRLLDNAVVPAALALGLARAALALDAPGEHWAAFDARRDVWVRGGVRVDQVWPAAGACLDGHAMVPTMKEA